MPRSGEPDWAAVVGPVTHAHDPQVLYDSESLAQALRQLEVYGRDGLPVLSADGRYVDGWVTAADVLHGIARQLGAARPRPRRPRPPPTGATPTRSPSCGTRPPRCPATG